MSAISLPLARRFDVTIDRWVWLVALLGGLLLAVAAVLAPPETARVALALSAGLPVLAVVAGLHRHRPARVGPWLLMAAGLGLYWLGAAPAMTGLWERDAPLISAITIAGYTGLLVGVVGVLSDGDAETDLSTVLEAIVLAVAAALVVWFFLVAPMRSGTHAVSTAEALGAIAYPAIDLALFALAGRALVRYRRIGWALWLLLPALLASAATDVAGLVAFASGAAPGPWLMLGGSLAANAFVAAAALHPSLGRPLLADPRPVARFQRPRIALVGGATFIAPVLMLFNELHASLGRQHFDATEVGLAALLISGLVVGDLYLLLVRLDRSLRTRVELEGELKRQAQSDSLTALPNRSAFVARLEALMAADRDGTALLFCDLDDFKTVNDTLGHAAGDQLLVEVGRRLRSAIRPVDLVARLGGDEFGVLLGGLGARGDADAVATRILDAFHRPLDIGGAPVSVAISMGVAFGADAPSPAALMHDADVAMYRAKSHGKGRAERYRAGPRGAG